MEARAGGRGLAALVCTENVSGLARVKEKTSPRASRFLLHVVLKVRDEVLELLLEFLGVLCSLGSSSDWKCKGDWTDEALSRARPWKLSSRTGHRVSRTEIKRNAWLFLNPLTSCLMYYYWLYTRVTCPLSNENQMKVRVG